MKATKQNKKSSKKLTEYMNLEPSSLMINARSELVCRLCGSIINTTRKFLVEQHLKNSSHIKRKDSAKLSQSTLKFVKKEVKDIILEGFTGANIPLFKLRNESVIKMFQKLNISIPCESTVRAGIEEKHKEQMERIKTRLKDYSFYIIADESMINGDKYGNLIIGKLEDPSEAFLVDVKVLPKSVTGKIFSEFIDDAIRDYRLKRDNFRLLLTDSVNYMKNCGDRLKVIYSNMKHINCFIHILHNCVLKIKSKYTKVDGLIGAMKMLVHKNPTRKQMFSSIGTIPEPIITRFGTWLLAALFYAENFEDIKEVVEEMIGDGVLFSNAQRSIAVEGLREELIEVHRKYGHLASLIYDTISATFSINDAKRLASDIQFCEDYLNLKKYILTKMNRFDYNYINEDENLNISIASELLAAPSTTIAVERSFSILGKIITKDRRFSASSVKQYMMLYYNTSLNQC